MCGIEFSLSINPSRQLEVASSIHTFDSQNCCKRSKILKNLGLQALNKLSFGRQSGLNVQDPVHAPLAGPVLLLPPHLPSHRHRLHCTLLSQINLSIGLRIRGLYRSEPVVHDQTPVLPSHLRKACFKGRLPNRQRGLPVPLPGLPGAGLLYPKRVRLKQPQRPKIQRSDRLRAPGGQPALDAPELVHRAAPL